LHSLIGTPGESGDAEDDRFAEDRIETGRAERVRQVRQRAREPVVNQQQRSRQVGRKAVVLGALGRGHVLDADERNSGHDVSGGECWAPHISGYGERWYCHSKT